MDEDALFAMGTVLAALGGILERNGVCTTRELGETLGGVAEMTRQAGPDFQRRAADIGSLAQMIRTAAIGAGKSNQN